MRKFLATVRINLIDCLAYRGDIFLYTLGGIIHPLISLFVWLVVASSSTSSPLSASGFVVYYCLVLIVKVWISTWAGGFISQDIRLGRMTKYLTRPFPFIYYKWGNNIAEKVFKMAFALPIVIFLIILFRPDFSAIGILNIIFFVPAFILAILLSCFMDICFGLVGFWLEDTQSFSEVFNSLNFLFSGTVIPLIAYPSIVRQINQYFPFRYTLSFPIEVLQGQINNQQYLFGLLVQTLWFLLVVYLYKYLWTNGLKKYSAVRA